MTDKKSKTVLDGFIKIVSKTNRKPNKLCVDQGREIYIKLMKKFLDDNDILIYSTYNEGKLTIGENFIWTLKSKIYKIMTANDSKSYLYYLDKLVNEYNNAYHRSICKKPIHADYSAFSEEFESNHKASKFKVDGRKTITKHKNIFSKG